MQQKLRSLLALALSVLMVFQMLPPRAYAVGEDDSDTTEETTGNVVVSEKEMTVGDWEFDNSEEDGQNSDKETAPKVYEDGVILIYSFAQLALVGSDEYATDKDYDPELIGTGDFVKNENGERVKYAPDATYRIVSDISIPFGSVWQLPEGFEGNFVPAEVTEEETADEVNDEISEDVKDEPAEETNDETNEEVSEESNDGINEETENETEETAGVKENVLFDDASNSLYIYNVSQLKTLASEDRETQTVFDGDMSDATFGTGSPVVKSDSSEVTYSANHNYIISSAFSYTYVPVRMAVSALKAAPALLAAANGNEGRDSADQVVLEYNGEKFILIGNRAQLEAIGSDQPVLKGDADLADDASIINDSRSTVTALNPKYTGLTYSIDGNYVIFRDIDFHNVPWTPLMFMGTMIGVKPSEGQSILEAAQNLSVGNRPKIQNIVVEKSDTLNVNEFEGIGFFATITNKLDTERFGTSGGMAIVENIELNNVSVSCTTSDAGVNQTLLNGLTTGLGIGVGYILDALLKALSLGESETDLHTTLSNLLNARAEDPTIFATGAFAGRVTGDVFIDNCAVTGKVAVNNINDRTGGFIGYTEGMTEYEGLSKTLGLVTNGLAFILNLVPYLGLGDLIDLLLGNVLPLKDLIPTGYIATRITNCYVEGLTGTVGQEDMSTSYIGGFVGQQIGSKIVGCSVKNSVFTIVADSCGGGFAGVSRDAIVEGLLDGVGIDLSSFARKIHPQSIIMSSTIDGCTYSVHGKDLLGGFIGAQTESYAIDDSINCDGKKLLIEGDGDCAGGLIGYSTVGWQSTLGEDENNDRSLLATVKQIAVALLSTDPKTGQQLLSLMGVAPSAVLGCQVHAADLEVSAGDKFAGGLIGKGEGLYLAAWDEEAKTQLAEWNPLFEDEDNLIQVNNKRNIVEYLSSVYLNGDYTEKAYAGGVLGYVTSASVGGLLNDVAGIGDFVTFTVRNVDVIGVDEGYIVYGSPAPEKVRIVAPKDENNPLDDIGGAIGIGSNSGSDEENEIKSYDVGGAIGMATGGEITDVRLNKLVRVECYNRAAGFVGLAGPGELVGTNGLTVNLLGLNRLLTIVNLLQVAQGVAVDITDCTINAEPGNYDKAATDKIYYTVEALGRNDKEDAYEFTASGFIGDSDSTDITNSHAYNLISVIADSNYGYAGGFIGTSETGGLSEAANDDSTAVKSLIEAGGLVRAVEYLVPSYWNCTVHFVEDEEYAALVQKGIDENNSELANLKRKVEADVAGGFVADMECGTIKNYDRGENDWYCVYNIDEVNGETFGGGFAGKMVSGSLASAAGGVSVLGKLDITIDVSTLLNVVEAYVPKAKNAGVKSEMGFTVRATRVVNTPGRLDTGAAGGYIGYASGAQVSYCDVMYLKHTIVTPPEDLEQIDGSNYFNEELSKYSVTGGRFAGGYVGNMDIGSAASLGKGLGVLGDLLSISDILSALNVVITSVEHSNVEGLPGGFSVMSTGEGYLDVLKSDSDEEQQTGQESGEETKDGTWGKVGKSGGFAGCVEGGHIQDSDSLNFSYVIGEVAAGGYVGDFRPGDVAKLLDNLGSDDNDSFLKKALDYVLEANGLLASLVQAFVPVIRNSTTTCIPCGGAVRANAPSDKMVTRGMAGGFCGHNEGGQIWGMDNHTWKEENDEEDSITHKMTKGNYTGPQSVCYADRIKSVYGYEYAGGFTGFMEPASVAETGNLKLLSGLLTINNVASALKATYPTEESTAVFGPLRHLTLMVWNAWVKYVGQFGGYGLELSKTIGTVNTQEELNPLLEKYRYGTNVVAGRPHDARVDDTFILTEGGDAGGYVGLMVGGTITYGQAFDTKLVRSMRSAGGFAGNMAAGGAAELGNTQALWFINLDLSNLLDLAQVFVPCIKNSSVEGFQSGMTVVALNDDTDLDQYYIYKCGYAGGYVGSAYGGQIWGDADNKEDTTVSDRETEQHDLDGYTYYQGCNVENLRYVQGLNATGGYAGMATSGTLANVDTEASNGFVQKVLDVLVSRDASNTASVLEATMSTIRGASVTPSENDWGFVVEGIGEYPRYAGGFIGYSESTVMGTKDEQSFEEIKKNEGDESGKLSVTGLRSVDAKFYAGGFVGLADVGGVADVASTDEGNGQVTLLQIIQAGNVSVLDAFRTYIYNGHVTGVKEGLTVRAHSDEPFNAILLENRIAGCAGGFGGGIMDGSVKNSTVDKLSLVSGMGYCGGFVGHGGKSGVADVDKATVGNDKVFELLSANAGIIDVFGSNIHYCTVTGIDKGYDVESHLDKKTRDEEYNRNRVPIAGGFAGYGDESRIVGSNAENLKLVISDKIGGGYIGKTDMSFLVNAEIDSLLVRYILKVVDFLLKILYIHDLEHVGLIDLASIEGYGDIADYLDLKLFARGNVLYVNLLGLRVGVSLVEDHTGNGQDTAVITLGDSTIALPCSREGGIDTEGRDAEIELTLIKGNRTKVEECKVTGIDDGYNVYAGGSTFDTDATETMGYAGGFVGQNHEGYILNSEMDLCDIVKGASPELAQLVIAENKKGDDDDGHAVGHFSGISQLDTVYKNVNNRDSIEGENNRYHVYRETTSPSLFSKSALTIAAGTPQTVGDVKYQRYDVSQRTEPVVVYFDWDGAMLSDGSEALVYETPSKAVLMRGTDNRKNSEIESLIPEPGQVLDPCENNVIDFTIQKVWNDLYDMDKLRPDDSVISVRLVRTAQTVEGVVVGEKQVVTELENETVDGDGYFTMSASEDGRIGSATLTHIVYGLPAYGTATNPDPESDEQIVVYYTYEVEELEVPGYQTRIDYDDTGMQAKITNIHRNVLPATGSMGDIVFIFIGAAALLVGSNGVIRRKDTYSNKRRVKQ